MQQPQSGKIQLAGDLEGTADAPTITNAAVIAKVLTGFSSAAGTVLSTDNVLQGFGKINGNVALNETLKANLASPIFTGIVGGITQSMVGLSNVNNTTDADKEVSTLTQTALALKAPLASPTFEGTPTLPTGTIGITQTPGNNSTALATTAYADAQVSAAVTGKQNTLTNSAGLAGALSDETGTGLAVFDTSPVLVAPNLGTPTALVGTNITGTASVLNIGGNAATATIATKLSGGAGGSIPYQITTGNTGMLVNGTAGQVLQSNGTTQAPSWVTAVVREVADQVSASNSQTSFPLSQTKSSNSTVKMYINGVRISNTAYSINNTILTYNNSENGNYVLVAGDRIQFDYYY